MAKWALQDAKAQLSKLVRAAEKEPQTITLRGEEKAVLLSVEEYRKLKGSRGRKKQPPTLYEMLRACPYPLEIPPRSKDPGRDVEL